MVVLVRGALFGVVALVAASGIAVPGVGHSAVGGSYSSEISPNSKVRITYDGALRGVAVVRDRSRNSRLTFGGVNLNFEGTREVPIQGTYRVVVNYDGASVSGVETQSSNVQGLSGVFKFQGQRVGSNCMLTFNTGEQATANCTPAEFSYNTNSQSAQGEPIRLRFEGRVTSVVDVAEEARLEAEARAKADREAAAKAAEQQRQAEIARIESERQRAAYQAQLIQQQQEAKAFIRSRPAATQAQSALLAQAINQDAQFWLLNKLDQGRMYDVVTLPPPSDDVIVVRGSYTYNGGSPGWANVRIRGTSVECIEYWDSQGSCAPIRYAATSNQSGYSTDWRAIEREVDRQKSIDFHNWRDNQRRR